MTEHLLQSPRGSEQRRSSRHRPLGTRRWILHLFGSISEQEGIAYSLLQQTQQIGALVRAMRCGLPQPAVRVLLQPQTSRGFDPGINRAPAHWVLAGKRR